MSEAALTAAIIRMQQQLDAIERDLNRIPSRDAENHGFWAKLTAATSVASGRYKYSWTEITWTVSGGVAAISTPSDARVGPATITGIGSTGYAWNCTEMDNTGTDVGSGWSDNTLTVGSGTIIFDSTNPVGITQKGNTKRPVVWLRPVKLESSNELAYLFAGWNTPRLS